jgi:hypothetical protein
VRNSNKYLLRFIVIALLFSVQSFAQRTGASLRGGGTDKAMKLYWETYDWPGNLAGFTIKRQSKGNNGWTTLTPQVIYPQVDERNWENLGLTAEETKALQETFQRYLAEGKLSRITKDELLQKLQASGGLKSGDRLNMKQDYSVALILGFAYIDHAYKKSEHVRYGLFYVYNDGRESEQPVATFTPESVKITPVIEASVRRNKITLLWTVKEREYQTAGLFGFNISRKEVKSGKETSLTEDLIGYQKADNGQLQWIFTDESANASLDYTYSFIPVTILQTELKPVEFKYKAALYQRIPVSSIDSIVVVDETALRIYWKTDSLLPDKKRIRELYLEKRNEDTLHFSKIKKLESKNKFFTDTTHLQFGQSYVYRLSVTDTKGKEWYGAPETILYTGVKLPGKPDSLRAEFKMILDKPHVHLTWVTGKNTHGFVLLSDEEGTGKLKENLSVPLIKNNELLYEVSGDGGINYQFSIVPVNEKGMRGEGSTVTCSIPLLSLPLFQSFSATYNKNNLVELSWNYPKGIDLKGFNILVNGNIIATPQDLSIDSRSYTVQLYNVEDAKKVNVYQVEAVGTVASRKSSVSPLYQPAYKLAPPQNLKVTLTKDKGKTFADLSWNYNKDQIKDINGYILFTDDGSESYFYQITKGSPHKDMNFNYLINNPGRNSYTFKVVAVSHKGEISPAASITLSLKDIKK